MLTRKQLWRKCKTCKINNNENNDLNLDSIPIIKKVKFNNIVDVILIPINKYHSF